MSILRTAKMPSGEAGFRKAGRRLIPFLIAIYTLGWLDRVNVGFAALTMNRDLNFSPAVYGFGAGAFFLGYFILQVPANLGFARVGARRWMFWSMLVWGAISAANAFVVGPLSFYLVRFLLGAAEAGFLPGLIYYLTLWFPQAYRAQATARFMAAIPLATIIGGPLSSLILAMDGTAGLHGWQWLFLLEGFPACLCAFVCLRWLPSGPSDAGWLTEEEREIIVASLRSEARAPQTVPGAILRDWRVLALASVSLALGFAGYGISLWLPQILQAMRFSNSATGLTIAALSALGMVAMIAWGRSSDSRSERIWHVAIPILLAAAGFLVVSVAGHGFIAIAALACVVVGFLAADGPFFALPSSFLGGAGAAAGIAFINAIGSLGAFAGPSVVGIVRAQTGRYEPAMVMLAAVLLAAAGIVLAIGRTATLRPQGSSGSALVSVPLAGEESPHR